MTILEVIQRSAGFLARKGVDSPRLQIELLLAHVLQMPRLKLYLSFERTLTEPQLATLRGFVKRRADREPLQHILGSMSFCGLELAVNRDALIPRPETEQLAESACRCLSTINSERAAVLDFGTGSGCLAVAIAVKSSMAQVYALDISQAALALARQNAARHGVGDRIQFLLGDGFDALPDALRFDLLVSNPPYIASAEIETLQPEVRDHDPRLALDGGKDGLEFYRRLAAEAPAFLTPAGRALFEFGDGQEPALREIFQAQKWAIDAVERDLSGRARILIARHAGN